MEKEKWIQQVLNSTNGMTAVTPNDDVLIKIKQKINQQPTVQTGIVWLVVASVTILVTANFILINQYKQNINPKEIYIESIVNNNNQLY